MQTFEGNVTVEDDSSGGGFVIEPLDSSADPTIMEYLVTTNDSSLIVPGENYTLTVSKAFGCAHGYYIQRFCTKLCPVYMYV